MSLDDMPGWNDVDAYDPGLPCAFGSLLACWVKYSAYEALPPDERPALPVFENVRGMSDLRLSVDSWVDNILQRIWLPGIWDDRIDYGIAHANRDLIAEQALLGLLSLKDARLPRGAANDGWSGACEEIGRLSNTPGELGKRLHAPADAARAHDMGMILRYFWIGRLHEVNRRWSPSGDFADARAIARQYGWGGLADDAIALNAVGDLGSSLL